MSNFRFNELPTHLISRHIDIPRRYKPCWSSEFCGNPSLTDHDERSRKANFSM